MSQFTDNIGQQWPIEFDAFLLEDVKQATGVDLADVSAGGYHAIATDAAKLGLVVCALCADELKAKRIDRKELAKRIRKDAIPRARKAVEEAAADFFPASEWSEIQSNLAKPDPMMGKDPEELAKMIPLMQAFQGLPESVQMQLIQEERESGSSGLSQAEPSAFGQDVTPLNAAIDSQESVEPTAVG